MNTQYEILTENGFKHFTTVSIKTVEEILSITFSDNKTIKCTPNHRFNVGGVFVEACELNAGDVVSPANSVVIDIVSIIDDIQVYDIVNVDGGNHYLTNGITSHNCEFLSSDQTLFDSYMITQGEEHAKKYRHNYKVAGHVFYKKLDTTKSYVVGVDPATGSGSDYSVIQVMEFPSMIQVMEYRTNSMSSPVVYTQLKQILSFLEQFTKDVYFSVENNGVGEGIIALYQADESPPVYAHFVSEAGAKRLGFHTSASSKIKAALKMKELFERRAMTVNSDILFHEMKNYVRREGAYAANPGATDDCIAAMLIIYRILEEMASYDDDAYVKLYSVDSEIEMEGQWEYDDDERKGLAEEYDNDEIIMPFLI